MAEPIALLDPESIVKQHQKLIAVLCRRMLGPGEIGVDAAQSVWEAVFKALPQFRAESALSTWLYRIAVRTILQIRQAEKRESLRALRRRYHVDEIPSPVHFRPDFQFWVRDTCERCMQGTLFCLSPEARLIFIFRSVCELGYDEIAAIMDKSPTAVRQIASRGRRLVQRFIANDCAFAHDGASCRCGMDAAVKSIQLPREFARLRQMVSRVHTWKLAEEILPQKDYWLYYAPDFAKLCLTAPNSVSQTKSSSH